jgi:hypothetical protein
VGWYKGDILIKFVLEATGRYTSKWNDGIQAHLEKQDLKAIT